MEEINIDDFMQIDLRIAKVIDAEMVENADKWVAKAYRSFYLRPSVIFNRLLSIRTFHDVKRHVDAFIGIVGFKMNDNALSIQKQNDTLLSSEITLTTIK